MEFFGTTSGRLAGGNPFTGFNPRVDLFRIRAHFIYPGSVKLETAQNGSARFAALVRRGYRR